jgi:hypothetical protein
MNDPVASPSAARVTSTAGAAFSQQLPASQVPRTSGPAANVSSSSASSTEALLKDFTLVAEAAKRAQVAVMVRDFESCGLS